MGRRKIPVMQRLLDAICPRTGGCWVWTKAIDREGYGKLGIEGKSVSAHRVSYEFWRGEIPDGYVIDHLCRNRSCVNPDHLEAVTRTENIKRGMVGCSKCYEAHKYH